MPHSDRQRATARSRAEVEFSAAQKKSKTALEENERLRDEKAQHVADLKAKRLAKEAEERGQAASEPAKKPAQKKKTSANLPQFHRF
jgi:hypothetical protein